MDMIDIILGGKRGGGGLPVVQLTTEPTEDGVTLTAEESAQLDAIGNSMFIAVCNFMEVFSCFFVMSGMSLTENGITDFVYSGRADVFGGNGTVVLILQRTGGVWTAMQKVVTT